MGRSHKPVTVEDHLLVIGKQMELPDLTPSGQARVDELNRLCRLEQYASRFGEQMAAALRRLEQLEQNITTMHEGAARRAADSDAMLQTQLGGVMKLVAEEAEQRMRLEDTVDDALRAFDRRVDVRIHESVQAMSRGKPADLGNPLALIEGISASLTRIADVEGDIRGMRGDARRLEERYRSLTSYTRSLVQHINSLRTMTGPGRLPQLRYQPRAGINEIRLQLRRASQGHHTPQPTELRPTLLPKRRELTIDDALIQSAASLKSDIDALRKRLDRWPKHDASHQA